jgi:hypothetical protein
MVTVRGDCNVKGGGAAVSSLPAEDYVCLDCGFSYPETSVERVPQDLDLLLGEVRAAVAVAPREWLHRRAANGTWSVLEYVCYLRDVYVTSTIRLHRAVTEDQPVLEPMLNDLRAKRFRYNERNIEAVLDDLGAAAVGFRNEVAEIGAEDWGRQISRLPGEHRSARWLVRHAVHEGQHHLRDIAALITPDPGQ